MFLPSPPQETVERGWASDTDHAEVALLLRRQGSHLPERPGRGGLLGHPDAVVDEFGLSHSLQRCGDRLASEAVDLEDPFASRVPLPCFCLVVKRLRDLPGMHHELAIVFCNR